MNEELVLHIINTACYGLNLSFSLVPQAPYLYVFFDRLPEQSLNYATLPERIRQAVVSAQIPAEYEYLALYSRIVGNQDPDWETALYIYHPYEAPESSNASAESEVAGETIETSASAPQAILESEPSGIDDGIDDRPSDLDSGISAEIHPEDFDLDQEIAAIALQIDAGAELDSELSLEQLLDPISSSDAEASREPLPPETIALDSISEPEPLSDRFPSEPADDPEETVLPSAPIEEEPIANENFSLEDTLPLPPPPPKPDRQRKPQPESSPKKGFEDMAQYYFKAKPKPNPESVPPVEAAAIAPEVVVPETQDASTHDPESIAPITPPPVDSAPIDLSGYCFVRNRLLLSSTLKPPGQEVIALVQRLHQFSPSEQEAIAQLLDNLYRHPPKKNNNDEEKGEAVLYQMGEVDTHTLSEALQEWFQAVINLDSESFRKSAIWLSRYCYNPSQTIAELGL